jgi:putative peptidoglycan lipid II flippase
MAQAERNTLISGTRITSLGTLASRILGMVRDMAQASLFGMSQGWVPDAFATAFRIPNTFRRLFGEGALAVSFLPVLAAELERSREQAWRLTSVMLALLGVVLTGLVLVIEGVCYLLWLLMGDLPGLSLVLGLTAVMMPYMIFMCLAAQAAAALQALSHFSVPALAPTLLNICWLVAVWFVAPWFAPNREAQAYVVAGAVLVAGALQLGSQLWMLRRLGFRYAYDWPASRAAVGQVLRTVAPMTLGLAITQINTLMDSLIAWGLTAGHGGPERIAWLGSTVRYPLTQGAATSIYYGERLYEFPLAILGIAVATAIYPLLSRHAARGDYRAIGADLTLGLRLVFFLGVPAAVGLVLMAEPLVRFMFEHGNWHGEDTARAARVIACFAAGVWAYCGVPVIVRGFYAHGDRTTPVRIGALMVLLNVSMDLTLIWPLAEAGLAVSTSICAVIQAGLMIVYFARHKAPLGWRALAATALRTVAATALMAAVCLATLALLGTGGGNVQRALRLLVPAAAGGAAYLIAYGLLGGTELRMLWSGVVERQEAG